MKSKIQGLVLTTTPYKEKDALVKILTQKGVITLYARGVYKNNAKNLRLVQPFSFNEFLIETRNTFPLLLQGNTIHFYYKISQDLLKSSVCMVIHDCIEKINVPKIVYDTLLNVWHSANENSDDFYFWSVLILKYCIESEGIQPYVNGCVRCQNMKVETVSIKDGGFLCPRCNHGQYMKWDVLQLKKIRALFCCDEKHLSYIKDTYSFDLNDFIYFAKWIDFHGHKNLSSILFLEAIRAL